MLLLTSFFNEAFAQCQVSYTFILNGNVVSLVATGSGGTGNANYFWSFGDGTGGSGSSQTHTFSQNGNYIVCVTYTDSVNFPSGCSATYCDTIAIGNVNCSANFYSYSDSLNTNLFYFTSTVTGTAPFTYSWDFGDGTSSSQANPTHTFTNGGNNWVCLTITDATNCSSTYCDTVGNNNSGGACFASFAMQSSNINPLSYSFYSYVTGVAPFIYSWNFGDGTTGNQANENHTYASAGTYQVSLSITDANGCVSVYYDSTNTNPSGGGACNVIYYAQRDSVNNLLVYLYPYTSGVAPFTYLWDFGDGNTSTQAFPNHTYANPGNYIICLTITDAANCSSTFCDSTSVFKNSGMLKYLMVKNTTAINENELSSMSINVFPNPAKNIINIVLKENIEGNLSLVDVLGKVIKDEKITGKEIELNVSDVAYGYYQLKISNDNALVTVPIVIAK